MKTFEFAVLNVDEVITMTAAGADRNDARKAINENLKHDEFYYGFAEKFILD